MKNHKKIMKNTKKISKMYKKKDSSMDYRAYFTYQRQSRADFYITTKS